jgi:hypothetical protein
MAYFPVTSIYLPQIIMIITGLYEGKRCSVEGWGTMLQAGRSRLRFPVRLLDLFSIYLIIQAALWPWSRLRTEMSTRNLPGGEGRPARKADDLTAICQPIAYIMWEPRPPTNLWAFTACYRVSFTFTLLVCIRKSYSELRHHGF